MPRSRILQLLLRRPRDSFAMMLAAAGVTAIMVNGLFLQHGPHPAPIFPIKPLPVAGNDSTSAIKVPRPRPVDPDTSRREPARVAKPQATQSLISPHKDAIAELITQRPPSPVPQTAPQQSSAQQSPSPQSSAHQSPPQSSPQMLAVQRALSDFGYGQIKPTGVYDADTRLAIQRFERDRHLPITGEVSERVRRELAALTGRPLD
jgi:hypothetical protein